METKVELQKCFTFALKVRAAAKETLDGILAGFPFAFAGRAAGWRGPGTGGAGTLSVGETTIRGLVGVLLTVLDTLRRLAP